MAIILVVDDLPADRQSLVTLLRTEGHRVLEAADGKQGLASVRAEQPDLVITGLLLLMSGMSGYEFVRELRLDPATRGIPVLLCVGSDGEGEARRFAFSSMTSWVFSRESPPEDMRRIVARALAGELAPDASRGTTVLVVEDAESVRELARRILEPLGYTVLLAANAEEAGEVEKANPVLDVLVTDVIMPEGNGPDLAARLLERRPGLRVVYMSGYTQEILGELSAVSHFLQKPFTSETLGRKIREALEG